MNGDRDERGALLLVTLVLVTALGFIAIAALGLADASFRDDRAAQTLRSEQYGASGALDVLATAMRGDGTWGRDGASCAGLTTTADGVVVQAVCTPVPGSGALLVGGLGARADRVVDLVASVSGVRVARERVEFVDGGGSAPGAVVRVRSWTVSP
jgi:hypothetical protein